MNNLEKFTDRREAGEILAGYLKFYQNHPNCILLALPRGGLPVAYEVSKALSLPLDVFIVRKLGVPGHEELAFGAIASGGILFFNKNIIQGLHLSKEAIQSVMDSQQEELKRREALYRGQKPFPSLENKTVILIDDGIATGATARAAIKALREQNPAYLVLAVPVAARATCEELESEVDELVCPSQPDNFYAVGLWYHNFSQTTDDEVTALLRKAHQENPLNEIAQTVLKR